MREVYLSSGLITPYAAFIQRREFKASEWKLPRSSTLIFGLVHGTMRHEQTFSTASLETTMIFVLADDNILHVLDSESESQGAFEGIDVEEGIYKFFDEAGVPLKAEFVKPNQTGKIFGMFSWVASGNYRLISAESAYLPWLSEFLGSIAGLEKNSHFSSVEEVQKFLKSKGAASQ